MKLKRCMSCFQSKPVADYIMSGIGVSLDCMPCRQNMVASWSHPSLPLSPTPMLRTSMRHIERKAREAAAPGFATSAQIAARRAYYGGRCWMCGKIGPFMDHVKPLARGGSMWPSNLRPACWTCNGRKGAIWPWPPPFHAGVGGR